MSNQPPSQPPPPPPPPGEPPASQATPQPAAKSEGRKPWFKRWWGIALILLGVFMVLGILVSPDEDANDAMSAGEPEDQPEASLEEEPEPEPEAEVADDPEPVEEAPEPEPDPEPFEAVTIEGAGDDIIDVPVVDDYILVATFTHRGQSNFAVTSYDQAGNRLDLLVNEIGSYQGTVPYNFEGSPAEFEVNADGPWTVTINDLFEQPVLQAGQDGTGDQVLQLAASGRLTATHGGDSNFALLAWGQRRDLLVNEIGTYEGTVRLPEAVALEIVANGSWNLQVE